NLEGGGRATFGSNIELSIAFNKPLADKDVRLESVKEEDAFAQPTWSRANSSTAVGQFMAQNSMHFRVHAVDTDNFENAAIEEFNLIIKPDQMPSVVIENPRGPEDRTPVAVVPLAVMAEDDFDITSL